MYNTSSIKYPAYSATATHRVFSINVSQHFFIESLFPPDFAVPTTQQYSHLANDTNVIVLEEFVGFKGLWHKIKVNDKIGYVKSNVIEKLQMTSPSFTGSIATLVNTEKQYLPDYTAPEINWLNQKPFIVYDDKHNGTYAVHYELENVTSIDGNSGLIENLKEAHLEGTKLILLDRGFSLDLIEKLTSQDASKPVNDKYFIFSRAEEWYIDPRPCSTLRVLVAIPKRYLEIKPNPINASNTQPTLTQPSVATTTYFTKTFNNYIEYEEYFEGLQKTLNHYQLAFANRTWTSNPESFPIDLSIEASQIKTFYDKLNDLLSKNISNTYVNTKEDLLTNLVYKSKNVWLGKLDLIIDKKNLVLTNIEFKTYSELESIKKIASTNIYEDLSSSISSFSPNTKININNGFLSFLNDDVVKNKTTVNYFISYDQESDAVSAVSNIVDLEMQQNVTEFLLEKHYPIIKQFEFKSPDLLQCIVDNANRLDNLVRYKTTSEIDKFLRLRQLAQKEQRRKESDEFTRALENFNAIPDPSIRILFGIDEPPGKTPKEKLLNFITIARRIDWAKFLAIATACMARFLTPQEYSDLLNKYTEAKKYLETLASNTICNPYLTNALKTVNMFSLPDISDIDPYANTIQAIEQAIINLTRDFLTTSIKNALNNAAKACLNNPNTDYGGNPSGLGDDLNQEDPEIDDILNNLRPEDKQKAKDDLSNLLDDLASCLSPEELCRLFNGSTVNDEVLQIIASLVKRKYPDYSNLFNSRKYISDFFANLGSKIDTSFCPPSDADAPPNRTNVLCDDGRIQQLREGLLAEKGLTSEQIDDLLKGIKEKEKNNLEDVFKLLNSDKPFNLNVSEDLLCKLIPDNISLSLPESSFNQLINSYLDPVYNAFDEESKEWYKVTYSIKSDQKPFLKFDPNTGEISQDQDNINATDFSQQKQAINAAAGRETDPQLQEQGLNKLNVVGGSSSDVKIPYFLFKKTIKENTTISSTLLSSSINGNLQQSLDSNLPFDSYRTNIANAELLLADFAKNLFLQTEAKIKIDFENLDSLTANNSGLKKILTLLDLFLRNNIDDFYYLKAYAPILYEQLKIPTSNEANSFFANLQGAPLYLAVANQIEQNKSAISTFITTICNLKGGEILIPNPPADNLNLLLQNLITEYSSVKSYYATILKSKANYPDYSVQLNYNLSELTTFNPHTASVGNNSIVLKQDNDQFIKKSFYDNVSQDFYDLYTLKINRNNRNYISISNAKKVNEQTKNYISTLNIEPTDLKNKNILFEKYIKDKINKEPLLNKQFIQNIFNLDISYNKSLNLFNSSFENNILSFRNKFIFLKETAQNSNEAFGSKGKILLAEEGTGQPYTQYLQLYYPQTVTQKECNIRPNYLDIDDIKNDMKKGFSRCPQAQIEQEIALGNVISTEQLEQINLNNEQKALVSGIYRLAIRTCAHEIVLRGLPIFGYYDPQSLRDDDLFINFITDLIESEIRGQDSTFFNMMSKYIFDEYKEKYPSNDINVNQNIYKKIALRQIVKYELQNYVLPKLTKRIIKDTNYAIKQSNQSELLISLVNLFDDIKNNQFFVVTEDTISIKLFVKLKNLNLPFINNPTIETPLVIYKRINPNYDVWNEFKQNNENEYNFLVNYLLQPSKILTYYFIVSCLTSMTRKETITSFKDTKKKIFNAAKIVVSDGREIKPDPNNAQDVSNNDPLQDVIKFIIKALIETPIRIIKAQAELSEPNIAVTSKLFKAAKALKPDLPSILIPATSIPLGLIPTPITCPLPFLNPILAGVYFGTLAWYEDGNFFIDLVNKKSQESLNSLLGNIEKEKIDCSTVKNEDETSLKPYPLNVAVTDNNDYSSIYVTDTEAENIGQRAVDEEQELKLIEEAVKTAEKEKFIIDHDIAKNLLDNSKFITDINKKTPFYSRLEAVMQLIINSYTKSSSILSGTGLRVDAADVITGRSFYDMVENTVIKTETAIGIDTNNPIIKVADGLISRNKRVAVKFKVNTLSVPRDDQGRQDIDYLLKNKIDSLVADFYDLRPQYNPAFNKDTLEKIFDDYGNFTGYASKKLGSIALPFTPPELVYPNGYPNKPILSKLPGETGNLRIRYGKLQFLEQVITFDSWKVIVKAEKLGSDTYGTQVMKEIGSSQFGSDPQGRPINPSRKLLITDSGYLIFYDEQTKLIEFKIGFSTGQRDELEQGLIVNDYNELDAMR